MLDVKFIIPVDLLWDIPEKQTRDNNKMVIFFIVFILKD